MANELLTILEYIEQERGISRESLVRALESAILTASRKSIHPASELKVKIDPATGQIQAWAMLEVVESNPTCDQLVIARARERFPDVKLGDVVEWEVTPRNFGRSAAQTARQAIIQQLRKAEKENVQEEFAARLARHPQVLCVVNRRKTAQQLYAALPAEGSYCLTTLLCAADRRRQLDDIRQRLKEGLPCRVVSTSLIEAGVDVDFPVAYREQCGLDSLLQTAGRCNREGRRGAEESIVYRFRLDECSTPQMLRQNVSALDYTARHQDTSFPTCAAPTPGTSTAFWMPFSGASGAASSPLHRWRRNSASSRTLPARSICPSARAQPSVNSCAAVMLPGRCCGSWAFTVSPAIRISSTSLTPPGRWNCGPMVPPSSPTPAATVKRPALPWMWRRASAFTSKKREAAKHTPLCRFPLTSPTSIKYFNPHQRHPNLQRHQQYTEKRTFFQHFPDNSSQLLDSAFEKEYTKLRKDIETYPIIK